MGVLLYRPLMNPRSEKLLRALIEKHIATAAPVSSTVLVSEMEFNISSATIRKEMAALENEGWIEQPHTSAGRVPTEKAYRLYAEQTLSEIQTRASKMAALFAHLRTTGKQAGTFSRQLARFVAEITHETAIVGFGQYDIYHTGIAHLFSKPEFSERALIRSLSLVIDRFDEIIENLYECVPDFRITIGSQCPFGSDCAAIFTLVPMKKSPVLFVLLGPQRMNYEKNISVMKQAQVLLMNY